MARTEQTPRPRNTPPGFGAGGEGWDGSEDPSNPASSAQQRVASDAQRNHPTGDRNAPRERDETMQSDHALSQSSDDSEQDGRYGIAEEQNFDQQSDAARRVGQAPDVAADIAANAAAQSPAQGASAQAREELEQSIARAVPKSD